MNRGALSLPTGQLLLICTISILLLGSCQLRRAYSPDTLAPPSRNVAWTPPLTTRRQHLSPHHTRDLQEEVSAILNRFQQATEGDPPPLSLAEAIDIALLQNPTTYKSWASARLSAAEFGQSLKNEFPLLEGDGEYGRHRFSAFLGPQRGVVSESRMGYALKLTYILLDFGQTRLSSQAALDSLYEASWNHNANIQSLTQEVMNRYYRYLYAQSLLTAREADLDEALIALEATQAKLKQGVSDLSDSEQAQTNYLQKKLDLIEQNKSLYRAYSDLLAAMGLPPTTLAGHKILFTSYPQVITPFEEDNLNSLIVEAAHHRPDLAAALAALTSKENALKAAKADYYPTLTTKVLFGQTYYSSQVDNSYNLSGMLILNIPLFQGFFTSNSIGKAAAQLQEAEADLKQIELKLIQEVTLYRQDLIYAQEALVCSRDYLESAREDYTINLEKYRMGTVTIVDLIGTQTAVVDARAKLAHARYSYYSSLTNLAYAIGLLPPTFNEDSRS